MEDWRFVGRGDELRYIRQVVARGRPNALVLAGAAGVGKTRLANEALRQATDAGWSTARANASRSAADLPFGAFAPLMPENHSNAAGAVDDRADLLRRSVLALARRGGERRMGLLVDDAHLLDDASATLVHQLVSSEAAFVLLTVRINEPAPDAVVALWKDGLAERTELGPLSDGDVRELLETTVGGSMDPAALATLTERCRGNALFLRELVLGALQSGALTEQGGIWRLTQEPLPSDRLTELVGLRLERLDEAERDLLELVSTGEPIGQAELNALTDPALAEDLERRALLSSTMNDRRLEVRLAHPLYGDVLRARTPAIRARRIARSLAEVVESTGCRRREDVLRVASWRLTGGDARPETLLAGAKAARWRCDFALAERLARAAVTAGAGFEASLLAAQLAGLQGRSAEAEEALATLFEQAEDDAQRGRVALARYDNSVIWRGSEEHEVFDAAMATISDPIWRTELEAMNVHWLLNRKGPRVAAEAAEGLLTKAQGRALDFTCLAGAYSLAQLGRIDEALEVTARGRAARLAVHQPVAWYPWWHTWVRSLTLTRAGRLAEAEALATEEYRQALSDRSVEAQAAFALIPAFSVEARGNLKATVRQVRESVALHQQLDRPVMLRFCYTYEAMAHALAGQVQQGRHSIASLDALELSEPLQQELDVIQARGWVEVAAGNLPEARRRMAEAADLGAEIGDLVGETSALHCLARLGRAAQVAERLAAVASVVEGPLAAARLLHTESLANDDPAGLLDASQQFESLDAYLLAAEAAADAANTLQRSGNSHKGAAAEHRAGSLAGRCEGATTPALHAVETRARLTPAERDTALLAAAGHANKQIADELYLSVRTVENRLQRVYGKLGISGRTELREALEP